MAIVDKDIITLEIDNSLQRRVTATKHNKQTNDETHWTAVRQLNKHMSKLSYCLCRLKGTKVK